MASAALPDGLSPRRATNGCEISGLEGRRVLRDDVVMSATVIDKNHGLTLPESICSALGLQPNDQVEWRVEDGEIRGRKLPLPALADAKTQFQELAEKWRSETGGESSLARITGNINYLRVIALGKSVVPLIIERLKIAPEPWFVALRAITGEMRVGEEHRGNFRNIAKAWVDWSVRNGYSP